MSDRKQHYRDTLGNVPQAIAVMFAMDEDFANAYTDIREGIYTERPDGMSLAMKELLLVMFDLSVTNVDGAINHMRAARRAGLTQTQLHEALMCAFLVLGVSGWGMVGQKLWNAWLEDGGEGPVSGEGA
jgi:alkylhydroperoxidase/carboxymuconolactone decarboxylase family protein YurZ